MKKEEKKGIAHNLEKRVKQLPRAAYSRLLMCANVERGFGIATFRRFLKGESENLNVLSFLASFFNCSFEEILNPEFELSEANLEHHKLIKS